MKVLISRHAAAEGPGYLADFLRHRHIAFDLVKVDAGEPLPDSIADYDGFVLMGGPMSVNDNLPWIPRALDLIRAAVDADKPVLGHCLGGQLIAKALGGEVRRNRVPEIGWLPVRPVNCGVAHQWLDGCPPEFEAFHWHGETFSVPQGGLHILQSQDCFHQAFAVGKTLALQCHIEVTADMVKDWIREMGQDLKVCATIQNPDQITADLYQRVRHLHTIADRIYQRWIEGL